MHRLSDYDYHLPAELIAQAPLPERTASRLLLLHRVTGEVEHCRFVEVPDILRPGDLVVFNDTRVTALRLFGRKSSGGDVEALLLRPRGPFAFEVLVKPGRRLKMGATVLFENGLTASVSSVEADGLRVLTFEPCEGFDSVLARTGRVPLPPYITQELSDPERYQTVLAKVGGSSAAPTAGLHFSEGILLELATRGIDTATVTLDVGLDTFRPVQTEDLGRHQMHGERCDVPVETAEKIERCQGRIVAVGTTTVRTLESMAKGPRQVDPGSRSTHLFIRPGFNFQVIDGMFTNFHLPRTTMLIMLSALVGRERLLAAYDEAVRHNYRFLSFGDSMLVL